MAVHCECPLCKASLRVAVRMVGQRTRCPKCGGVFQFLVAPTEGPLADDANAGALRGVARLAQWTGRMVRKKRVVVAAAAVGVLLVCGGYFALRTRTGAGGSQGYGRQGRDRIEEETTIELDLVAGINMVTFAYGGKDIAAESISITCTDAPGEVQIIGLVVPGGGELQWRVFSAKPGKGIFTVSYVVFGRRQS